MSLLCIAGALAPATAPAQGGSPFGPLPPPAPQPTPEPTPVSNPDEEDVSRETLFLVGLGVLAAFILMGAYITRDARRSLTQDDREQLDRGRERVDETTRQQRNRAKQRARAKGKAQRQARRKARGR